jgi:hydroxymethylbilane synthase
LQGNVDTRLGKLAAGECDALVLGMAGLERLGRAAEADGVLDDLVPAAGQGALAVEARPGTLDPARLARITDADAFLCVSVERELTSALGASCNTAVGAYARPLDGNVELSAWVGAPDGSAWIADRLCGAAAGLGHAVARRMIAAGAGDLLRIAERAA